LPDDPDPADFKGGYQTVVAILQGGLFTGDAPLVTKCVE
jgi:hypothetical protein